MVGHVLHGSVNCSPSRHSAYKFDVSSLVPICAFAAIFDLKSVLLYVPYGNPRENDGLRKYSVMSLFDVHFSIVLASERTPFGMVPIGTRITLGLTRMHYTRKEKTIRTQIADPPLLQSLLRKT